MQVTAFAHLLNARKRASKTSFGSCELTSEADNLSSILLLGDEDQIVSFIRRMASEYGYQLTKVDPGPCCCDYGDFYEREGVMPPIHNCPAEAPTWLDDETTVPKEW